MFRNFLFIIGVFVLLGVFVVVIFLFWKVEYVSNSEGSFG